MTEHNYLQASPNTVSFSNGTTTTITRSVPRRCEVCKGKAKRMPTCEPCEGKGWLYVYETETTYLAAPYIAPAPYTQPYTPPYTPQWTPTYNDQSQNQTVKPIPFVGIQAINCLAGSHD